MDTIATELPVGAVVILGAGTEKHQGKIEIVRNAHAYVRWNNGFGAWVEIEQLEQVK